MNKSTKTRRALEASIAHWQRMATGKERTGEKPSGSQCGLCRLFLESTHSTNECEGCPVYERTERQFCKGTPYDDAHAEWSYAGFTKRFRKLAREELRFLESLLPSKTKARADKARAKPN